MWYRQRHAILLYKENIDRQLMAEFSFQCTTQGLPRELVSEGVASRLDLNYVLIMWIYRKRLLPRTPTLGKHTSLLIRLSAHWSKLPTNVHICDALTGSVNVVFPAVLLVSTTNWLRTSCCM